MEVDGDKPEEVQEANQLQMADKEELESKCSAHINKLLQSTDHVIPDAEGAGPTNDKGRLSKEDVEIMVNDAGKDKAKDGKQKDKLSEAMLDTFNHVIHWLDANKMVDKEELESILSATIIQMFQTTARVDPDAKVAGPNDAEKEKARDEKQMDKLSKAMLDTFNHVIHWLDANKMVDKEELESIFSATITQMFQSIHRVDSDAGGPTNDKGRLSKEDVKIMMNDVEKDKAEDEKDEKQKDKLSEAIMDIFNQVIHWLDDSKMVDKEELKSWCSAAITQMFHSTGRMAPDVVGAGSTNNKGRMSKEDDEILVHDAGKFKANDKNRKDKPFEVTLNTCNELIHWFNANQLVDKEELECTLKEMESLLNPIFTTEVILVTLNEVMLWLVTNQLVAKEKLERKLKELVQSFGDPTIEEVE